MLREKTKNQVNWVLSQDRFLSEPELRKLMHTAQIFKSQGLQSNNRLMVQGWFLIVVAIETGLRVQEIADLCCGDLSLEPGHSTVFVRNGKGNKSRIVHVRNQFRKQAERFLRWKQKNGQTTAFDAPLFSFRGHHLNKRALQDAFRRILAKAGIHRRKGIGIHCCRHTYASFLLKASQYNLRLVQRQLGHASVRTTEVYAHVFDPDMQQAVARLYS